MAHRICAACGEVKRLIGRGLCSKCWQRAKKSGTRDQFGRARLTIAESLGVAKANETGAGCWPWPKADRNGYPTAVKVDGKTVSAHVAVYLREVGPIPDGLTLDHLCHTASDTCSGGRGCRHRRCVRPSHLEPVTYVEQSRRKSSYRSASCKHGHLRTDANTAWYVDSKGRSYRQCRDCDRARDSQRGKRVA